MRRIALFTCTLFLVLTACAAQADEVVVTLGGDCVLGTREEWKDDAETFDTLIAEKGFDWCFSKISEPFLNDDISLVNLETVLQSHSEGHARGKEFTFRGDPSYTGILKAAGIEQVNIANNHTLDYGQQGKADTIANLEAAGIVVSGGGGYYVKTGVTELDRDKYPVGTQMRIQSWEHGEVYGTVAEISDTPVPSSNNPYYSSGNQNVSFYTMLIALDADSPLREDEWVDVYFNAASTTSEDALCIETRFIRQDDGGSYVYRRGEDQLLHKQYVTTGVVQWGYTEIKSGLTADDWIAFPYGKDVKENAETIESDNSDDFYYYGSY